jgi:hypothetical protein
VRELADDPLEPAADGILLRGGLRAHGQILYRISLDVKLTTL